MVDGFGETSIGLDGVAMVYKAIIGANWRAMCFGETTMGVNGMTIDFNGNQPSVIRSIGNEPSVSSFNCCLQNWTLWTLQPNIVIWKMLGSRPNIKRVVVTWTRVKMKGREGALTSSAIVASKTWHLRHFYSSIPSQGISPSSSNSSNPYFDFCPSLNFQWLQTWCRQSRSLTSGVKLICRLFKTRNPQSGEMEQVDKFAFLPSRALSPENWR